jgi:hypothetical protein
MEQGNQSDRAAEPEWPQRLNEWGRVVPASSLTMLYQRCAKARSRREELVEVPERGNCSGRGLLIGVLLGAGMWAAILGAISLIKL